MRLTEKSDGWTSGKMLETAVRTWDHLSQAVPTWSFGLPVCDATQPENDGSLVLLHNLQRRRGMGRVWLKNTAATRATVVSVIGMIEVTHLQRKPNGDRKENNGEDAWDYDQDPAAGSQRAAGPLGCKAGHEMRLMWRREKNITVEETSGEDYVM